MINMYLLCAFLLFVCQHSSLTFLVFTLSRLKLDVVNARDVIIDDLHMEVFTSHCYQVHVLY